MKKYLGRLGVSFLGMLAIFSPGIAYADQGENLCAFGSWGMMGGAFPMMGWGGAFWGWLMMIVYFSIAVAVLTLLIIVIIRLVNKDNKKKK